MHCGDDRLLRREQSHRLNIERVHSAASDTARCRKISARAEALPGRTKHVDAKVALLVDIEQCIRQIAHQLHADMVVWWPVNRQHRDMTLTLERHFTILRFHSALPEFKHLLQRAVLRVRWQTTA